MPKNSEARRVTRLRATVSIEWDIDLEDYGRNAKDPASSLREAAVNQQRWVDMGLTTVGDLLVASDTITVRVTPTYSSKVALIGECDE